MILKVERKVTENEAVYIRTSFMDNIKKIEKEEGKLKIYTNDLYKPEGEINYIDYKTEENVRISAIYLMNDIGQTIERIL